MSNGKVVLIFSGPSMEGRTLLANKLFRYLSWMGINTHLMGDVSVEKWGLTRSNHLAIPTRANPEHVSSEAMGWLQGVELGVLVINATLNPDDREGVYKKVATNAEAYFVEVVTDPVRALGINLALLKGRDSEDVVTRDVVKQAIRLESDRYVPIIEEKNQPFMSIKYQEKGCERFSFHISPKSHLAYTCIQYLEDVTLDLAHFYLASHGFDQEATAVRDWSIQLVRRFRGRVLRILCATDMASRTVMDALIPEVKQAFSADERECGFHHKKALDRHQIVPNLRGKSEEEVRRLMVLNPEIDKGYLEAGLNTDYMAFHVVERIMLEVWERWMHGLPEGVEEVIETPSDLLRRLSSVALELEGRSVETLVIGPKETLELLARGYAPSTSLTAPGLIELQQVGADQYSLTQLT